MTDTTPDAAASLSARRRMPTWATVAIAAFFGLFYAYGVWNALAFLVSRATDVFGLNGYGWFVLILPVVFPLAAFAVAFRLGSHRRWWEFALTMLAGLALVSVFWLNILSYAAVFGASLRPL
ncbi:MAG TPA: bacitracin resistance protein [Microbacterium sp.]|nr:bacitracin resistance protein [Microbacterium sp.]